MASGHIGSEQPISRINPNAEKQTAIKVLMTVRCTHPDITTTTPSISIMQNQLCVCVCVCVCNSLVSWMELSAYKALGSASVAVPLSVASATLGVRQVSSYHPSLATHARARVCVCIGDVCVCTRPCQPTQLSRNCTRQSSG